MGLREIARRLDRIEAASKPPGGMCSCKPQSSVVVFPEPKEGDTSGDPDEPCARCGGKKVVISVVYGEDWRGRR
jgi:hypothetical protein